ncbi:hypothetical protein EDC94DRAFT_592187 [Helicostylum pulchrum]|nr:hypothetical protein EDC94DRAFT_592187 [Helicostylum pulchrum]
MHLIFLIRHFKKNTLKKLTVLFLDSLFLLSSSSFVICLLAKEGHFSFLFFKKRHHIEKDPSSFQWPIIVSRL